ncbi:hypothetical protein MASR2M78_16600 [Treponema sp.]
MFSRSVPVPARGITKVDRLSFLIVEVNKTPTGLQVVLSRTHTDFVRAIFELEVWKAIIKTVEIHKIVQRSTNKIVSSTDVDPAGRGQVYESNR